MSLICVWAGAYIKVYFFVRSTSRGTHQPPDHQGRGKFAPRLIISGSDVTPHNLD